MSPATQARKHLRLPARRIDVAAASVLCAGMLVACSRPPTDVAPVAAPAPAAAPTVLPARASPAPAAGYDFPLLARPGAPAGDPRIVSTDRDHPCGPIDTVRVASMPIDDPVFEPQWVVEFDAAGKELGKWGIANEALVVGVDADRLQFRSDAGTFWVDPRGALEKVADSAASKDLRTQDGMFDCPALPTFKASGAEQCFRVRDKAGVERRIALEGNCT